MEALGQEHQKSSFLFKLILLYRKLIEFKLLLFLIVLIKGYLNINFL